MSRLAQEVYTLYDTGEVVHTLRQLREASNMSVMSMAERLDVDRHTVTRWERKHTHMPLNMTIAYLSHLGLKLAIIME